jgi:hypothetical protein
VARRRELADVADGISGHFVSDTEWGRDGPLRDIGRAVQAGRGTEFIFDMQSATASPTCRVLDRRAALLHDELQRHLAARNIPTTWVGDARVTVHAVDQAASESIAVSCQVAITDDRERLHTSTRRTLIRVPSRFLPRLLYSMPGRR